MQYTLAQKVRSCGSNVTAQHVFYSMSGMVRVSFVADAQNSGRGFKLEYKLANSELAF